MNRLGNLPELNGLLDEFQPDSTIQDEQSVFRKQQSRKRTLDVRGLGDGETLAPELSESVRPATLGDSLYDFGSNVISSGEQTLSAVSGLADIATGGASRYAQEALGKGLDALGESVGFNQRKAFSDFNKKLFTEKTRKQRENISSAESFTDALKAIYNNPRGAVTLAGDTILPMMAGGVLGNLAKASGFVKTGTAAGALGEGAISAGLSLENIVNQREARRAQISDYLNSLGIGLATGMVGVAGGKLANKAGVTDVDAAIANGALRSSTNKGLVQKAIAPLIAGAIEGGEEAAQSVFETILTNASLNKPLTEGLGANVATGAALGTAMGSTFNLVTPLITKNDKGEALDPTTSTPYSDKRVSKVASKINSLLERKVELASQGLDTSAIDEHIERLKTGLANTKPENKPEVSQEIDTVTEYVDHVNNAIDSVKSINEAVSKESQLKELVKADKPGLTDDQAAQIAHNILNRTLYNTSKNKDDSEDVFKIVYADELVKSESPDYFKSEEDIDNEIEASKQVENEVKIVNRVPKPEDAQSSVETPTEAPQSPVEPQTAQTDTNVPIETTQPVEEPIETVTNEQPQQEQNVTEYVDTSPSIQETPTEAPQSPIEPQTDQTNTEVPVETNQPVEAPVEPKSKPKKSPKKPKSKKSKEKFEAIKAELEAIASATEEASPEVKGLTKQVEDIAEKASEDISLKDLSNDELKSELNNKESEYKSSDLKQEALNRINNGSLSFDDISGTDVFTVKEDTPLKKITKNTKSNSSKTTPKRKIRKLNAIIKELSNLDKNISTEIIDTLIENADGLVTKPRGIKLQKQTIAAQLKDFLNALKININNNNDLKTFFDEQESLDPLSKKQFVTVFNKAFNQQLISLDGSVVDNAVINQDVNVTGSSVEDVKKWIPKKVLESGIIEVVQSVKDLPAHLQSSGNILKSVIAWHGSPHDHNKFSTKHIGSGEGVQVYGHGLYFTDTKEIAEWYRDTLSNSYPFPGKYIYYKGEKLNPLKDNDPEKIAAYYIVEYGRDFAKDTLKYDNETEALKYVDRIKDDDISIEKIGRLYKVELAPKEDEYLLWDKPFSEQPKNIQEIIKANNLTSQWSKSLENGSGLYESLQDYFAEKFENDFDIERDEYYDYSDKVSDYLHSIGVRGIKYLDGSSRSKKDGSYNYVVFDDSDVSIQEKYSKGLSGAEGVYDPSTNKIYLIADMLTKDNINSVLAHELLHAKINSDPKLKKQLESIKAGLRDVFNEIKSGTYKGKYADVYYKAFQRVKNADTNVQDEFEEFLAYSVSEFNQDSKNIPSGLKKLVAKIISLIKVTLTRYGLPVSNLTPNDLTTLAMQAISSNNNKITTVSELSNEELIRNARELPDNINEEELSNELIKRINKGEITPKDLENYTNKVSNIEEKPLQKIVNQTAKTNATEIEAGKDTLSEPVPIVKRTADIINAEIDELNNKIDDLEDKISIEGSSTKIDRLLTKYTNKVRSLMRELHGVTEIEAPDVPVDINEVFLDDSIPEIEEASYDDFSDDVLLKDTDDDISMSLSNDIRFNIGELSKSSSDIIEKLSKEAVVNKTIRLKKDLKKADVPQEDIDLITRILSKLDPKNKGKYSWDTLIRAIEDNVKIESHADKVGAINHIEERLNKKALTETINGVAKQLEIVTVENYSDIEEDRVRDVLEKNSAKGAYDRFNNKIYIITSRHKSVKETVQTLSHELIGHLGVRKVLGERVYNFYARILRSDKTLLNDVIQLVPRYSVYIERWSKKEGNNIDDLDPKEILTVKYDGKTIKIPFEVGLRLADEYVARIAEKEVFYSSFIKDEVGLSKSKRKSLAKKRSKFLSKVVAKIAHFFRTRAGKQSQYLTKDDIKKALAESVNHVFKQTNFDYTRLISEADYLKLSAQTVEGLTSDAELEAVNMQIRASFLAKRAAIEAGAVSDDIAKTISLMISSDGYQIKKSAYTKRLDRIGGKIRRNKVLAPFFATGALNHAKYLSIIESRASGLYTDIQQLSRRFRKLSSKMNDKATHEAYLYFTNKDAEVPDIPLINNPKLDAELKQLLPQAKNAITELGSKLVGLGGLNSETYLANKDEYLPTMYVKYLDTYQGSKLKPSFRNYLKEKNKDYSELDREMMGQIKDPTFLVYNALNVISRDVALHQMYDAIYKASADSNLKWVLGDKDFIEDRYGNKITPMAIRDKIEYLKDLINIHETASKKRAVNFSVGTYESLKEELDYYERINEEYNQSVREDVRRLVRSTENRDVTEDDIDAFLNKNYIKMPDNRRFGSLAGQYVRKEVHDTFFNIDEAMEYISNPKDGGRKAKQILRNIHAGFKGIKVGLNPPSHIKNGISNFVHLDMGTNTNTLLLMGYTKSVLSDLYRGKSNRFIDYAYKSGLSSTTFSTNELSRFADSYSQFLKAAETKNPIYKIFPYMSGAFAKMMEFTSHIYGLNEMIFKTAALQDQVLIWEKENLPKGQTIETAGLDPIQKEAVIAEAAAHANKVLLDYSKVNNFVSGARQYYLGAPFLTYIYKTFPVMVENMAKRPIVASKYLIVFPYLMASLVMNAFDWDDDDFDKYMARLGYRARDSSTFTLLPFKDDNGDIQAVDFDYMFPLAPYFNAFNHIRNGVSLDSTTDFLASSAKVSHDLLYRDLGFLSGPIPQTISMLLNNEDTFTGKPVWTEGAPASQNIYEVVTHLASIMMPPWATETGVINKTLKAFNHYKKYDLSSEQFTPAQAFASGVGFNLRDAVDTEGFRIKMLQLQKKIRNTKSARVKRLREARRRSLSNQEIATINRQYAEEIKKTQKEISEFSKLIR